MWHSGGVVGTISTRKQPSQTGAVRDIGSVRIGAVLQTGISHVSSVSGVEGIALLRRGENPSEVLKSLKEAVEELNTSGLPRGLKIRAIYDRSELVQKNGSGMPRACSSPQRFQYVVGRLVQVVDAKERSRSKSLRE